MFDLDSGRTAPTMKKPSLLLRITVLAAFLWEVAPACASDTESGAVTMPVTIVDNLPFLKGEVNGSQEADVVVDTGAALSVVSPGLANRIGLRSQQSLEAGGFGQGSSQTLRLVDGVTLAWGSPRSGLRLPDQQVAVLPIDYIASQTGHPVDAIFGSNLFERFRVTLDYGHKRLTFAPFESGWKPSGSSVPIEVRNRVPVVEAALVGSDGSIVKAKFIVDVGTTGAMILSKRFLDAHPKLTANHAWADAPPVTAVGGTVAFKLIRLTGMHIGSFTLDGPVAAVPQQATGILADPELAGLIGGEILNRFAVTWDYRNARMWLLPNGRLHRRFAVDMSGLHLAASGADLATIHVDGVLPGSSAQRAGIRVGDEVAAVDGVRSPLWSMAGRLARSGSHTIIVERSGRPLRLRFRSDALR